MLKCHWLAKDAGVIPGFLSAEECTAYIRRSEAEGYEDAPVTTADGMIMMKDVRNNDRVMVDDFAEAHRLYTRAEPFLPRRIKKKWQPFGLNERLRFYRYDEGQQFDWHHDGYYESPAGERSFLTFMIYLNEGFEGGETSFTGLSDIYGAADDLMVSPRTGMALLFQHPLLHKGEPIRRGRKYVLRTDAMYSKTHRTAEPDHHKANT